MYMYYFHLAQNTGQAFLNGTNLLLKSEGIYNIQNCKTLGELHFPFREGKQ